MDRLLCKGNEPKSNKELVPQWLWQSSKTATSTMYLVNSVKLTILLAHNVVLLVSVSRKKVREDLKQLCSIYCGHIMTLLITLNMMETP